MSGGGKCQAEENVKSRKKLGRGKKMSGKGEKTAGIAGLGYNRLD